METEEGEFRGDSPIIEVVKQLQAYLEFIKVSVDTPVQHCVERGGSASRLVEQAF